MRSATEFAYDLMYPKKLFSPKVEWKDPVATDHMRTESDVVIFISGKLLAKLEDFKLYVSGDTGDYVTPYVIPPACLVSARRRLDGFNELEAPEVLEKSMLHEHPPEFFVATGQNCAEELLPSTWKAKSRRQHSPPQRARGSADPEPRDNSSRGSGAAPPRLRLKEAPWHKPRKESPSQSPRGAPDLTSKPQNEVSGSTREAEIPDLDPDSLAKDNKKTYKIPRPPKDEQPDEEEE
jgi:hypothetical protein